MISDNIEDTYFHVGPTFRIRETRTEDLATWYKWLNDPEVTQYLVHGIVPNTVERQEEFRLNYMGGENKIIYSIIAKDSSKLIGTCSINLMAPALVRRGEISMIIGDKKHRSGPIYLGITTWQLDHCFHQLNLNSVVAATNERNEVVQKTLERIGFVRAGVMRQSNFKDGRYWNCIWYDLLASEWANKRGKKL